ncbi:DUF6284 family protein [Streptomyces sp. NPDC020917]|uniref:DUF6284 family protein n=1 Tax=Streptomyces sp. NPDC020917 TaxID=3365102 RepID=UPI0037878734
MLPHNWDNDAADVLADEIEPTDAELAALECEMPVVLAEVELLDVQISLLDRRPNDLDRRRMRRAHNRLIGARRAAANIRPFPAGGVA